MLNQIALSPIVFGCMALLLGIMPGLLDGLIRAISDFRESLSMITATRPWHGWTSTEGQRRGFTVAGLVLVVLGVFASLLR